MINDHSSKVNLSVGRLFSAMLGCDYQHWTLNTWKIFSFVLKVDNFYGFLFASVHLVPFVKVL